MTEQDRTRLAARLVEAAMNPATPDGRAGLGALLRELEAAEPGAIQRLSAMIELKRVRAGAW